MSFIHLNAHSHYSLLQASCTVPDIINKCVELKMPSIALTDYGNMFGILEFYFTARKHGIKPLVGSYIYYVEDRFKKESSSKENFRTQRGGASNLVLLAKNNEGYKNLCMISTLSYQEGFYFVPRADHSLLNKYKEGLIAITAGQKGSVFCIHQKEGEKAAHQEVQRLKKIFQSSLYLGFQSEGVKGAKDYNFFLEMVAKKENIPLVAENDVHYLEKKDSFLQDVMWCIGINSAVNDRSRERLGPSEFYLKNEEQMKEQFQDAGAFSSVYQEACDRSLEVAERCNVEFKIKNKEGRPIYHLPSSAKEHWGISDLSKLAFNGLSKRFKEIQVRGEQVTKEQQRIYKERVEYELKIIDTMGFTGYFHIVEDFIRWAKSNDISVGPGRGSGASSLVSYCLGITDLDPMPLNLIFERFLNPERISMPDFDIDFCQENRHLVIEYINKKYGSDCTAHVVTYGRLSVRAAIRDAGRVLGLSYTETDQVAKLIPDKLGITLKEALKLESRLKARGEEDPQIAQLLQVTEMLENRIRHVGIHAAGIIIADTPITDYAPLYKGAEGENVIQYDLSNAEKIGLVKFDFLGLKTLTQIKEVFRLIKLNQGKTITTKQISHHDKGIYEIMSAGDTMGVFQFESRGITNLLTQSQPNCFEDIVAANALYRPGPMNMIPSYLDRKNGKIPVEYIFPELEPILKETYGIIVYQEHVHQIAVKIAGYSYGEADVLRRAMGKKIHSVMKKQKERFLKGAVQKKYDFKKAEKVFDLMAEFAKYGFNKSHAAAYCILAAQTAWLKRYYPVEFFASAMTIDKNDADKLYRFVTDAKKHEIQVIPPHINHSEYNFSAKGNKIYFSLGAIKSVGESICHYIVEKRESLKTKQFASIEEFLNTVDLQKVNRKAFVNLVKAGAFDGFKYHRRELIENYDMFLNYSSQKHEDRKVGQQSLFSVKEEDSLQVFRKTPWNFEELTRFEYEVFGFYLNKHPLKPLRGVEKAFQCRSLKELNGLPNDSSIQVLALLGGLNEVITRRKLQLMAFGILEDEVENLEVVFFPEVYKKITEQLIKEGDIILVKGKLKNEENRNHLIAESVILFDEHLKSIKRVCLNIYPDDEKELDSFKQILNDSERGSSILSVKTILPDEKACVEIDSEGLPGDIKVNRDFLEKMYKILKNPDRLQIV